MPRAPGERIGRFAGLRVFLVCATALLAAAACTTSEDANERPARHATAAVPQVRPEPPPYQSVEFAMPPGSEIDRDKTLAVGNNVQWYGTLSLTTDATIDEANAYYARELPAEGWEALSSLISDRVVLQFVNRQLSRACIVTIEAGGLWSHTHVEIVVAPLVEKTAVSRRDWERVPQR